MSDNDEIGRASTPQPNTDLKTLDKLVGTWTVSGEAEGTVTYEWTEGGFFLLTARRSGREQGPRGHRSRIEVRRGCER
jgi:hypothetical protein